MDMQIEETYPGLVVGMRRNRIPCFVGSRHASHEHCECEKQVRKMWRGIPDDLAKLGRVRESRTHYGGTHTTKVAKKTVGIDFRVEILREVNFN